MLFFFDELVYAIPLVGWYFRNRADREYECRRQAARNRFAIGKEEE